jgi:hypothetical protein
MRDSMTRIAIGSPAGLPTLLAFRIKREMAANVSGLGRRVCVHALREELAPLVR